MGCHALLQGIFPTQGSNPGLPHCRQILYHLRHKEVLLRSECARESAGRLVSTDSWAPRPEFLVQQVWGGAKECAFLMILGNADAAGPGTTALGS